MYELLRCVYFALCFALRLFAFALLFSIMNCLLASLQRRQKTEAKTNLDKKEPKLVQMSRAQQNLRSLQIVFVLREFEFECKSATNLAPQIAQICALFAATNKLGFAGHAIRAVT